MAQKMKSHSGAGKRFKITKGWKVKATKSCNNHLLIKKDKGNNKNFKYGKEITWANAKMIKNLLPYN